MAHRLSLRAARGLRHHGRAVMVLTVAVLGMHACVVDHLADAIGGMGGSSLPPRMKVAYVREMSPSAPAVAVPVAAPIAVPPTERRPRQAQDASFAEQAPEPEPAASAPVVDSPTASGDGSTPPPRVETPDAVPASTEPASAPRLALAASDAVQASAPPAAAASSVPFTWPASTRLSYRLTGQYRGEVHGSAQVEWILAAPRYQVGLDVTVGMAMAPLYTRSMRSEGRLSAAGLTPERYDENSKLAFRDRRRSQLRFDNEGVSLSDGRRWTRPTGLAPPDTGIESAVQDSASQFVQLSYLFTLQPQRLTPGSTIAFQLALPRRVQPWVYEVVAPQTLHTPFGPLDTFHVRPRPDTPRGNDLLAEAWFSPQLAYLPVRIRIEQDAENYIDLMIERKPQLAAPDVR